VSSVEIPELPATEQAQNALKENLPPLGRDRSFWGMAATQFLGAFNDNLFKALMLLLAVSVGSSAASSDDQQWVPSFVFALPFVLFSGYAGFLADRFSKQPIIVLAKLAEIAAMGLGMAAFLAYGVTNYSGLLVVLFLMGTQSAFFGPSKYGILPEMLREKDLPLANGVIVMSTFLAIILGMVTAGLLAEFYIDRDAPLIETAHHLWFGSFLCIVIAFVGTLTSLLVRRVPAAQPQLRFCWSALLIPSESRRLLRNDRPMLMAVLASCVFWLVAGIAIPAVNSLGLIQLRAGDLLTQTMTAMIGVGIALGSVIAGAISHGKADNRVVRYGTWGIVTFLLLISITLPGGQHLLGYWGSLIVLAALGAAAGMFAVPVQVFIQARPPEGMKGRMIAVMNQTNFVAIMLAAPIYEVFDELVRRLDWPRSSIFAMIAVLMLPVAVFYRLPDRVHREPDDRETADTLAE
jgi:acyl-[acyl-carrier-protein]-phospholipid O-acyltransferase/long-chain-fatty-acid--[acyl-carrier-protein] ligase